MEKEFVPYEQALILKELGFDEPCFGYYDKDDKSFELLKYFNYNTLKCISRPLYQQAFKFLLTLVNKDKSFTNKWKVSYDEDSLSLFLGGCNMGVYKTEDNCIAELIKIVKQE